MDHKTTIEQIQRAAELLGLNVITRAPTRRTQHGYDYSPGQVATVTIDRPGEPTRNVAHFKYTGDHMWDKLPN